MQHSSVLAFQILFPPFFLSFFFSPLLLKTAMIVVMTGQGPAGGLPRPFYELHT